MDKKKNIRDWRIAFSDLKKHYDRVPKMLCNDLREEKIPCSILR